MRQYRKPRKLLPPPTGINPLKIPLISAGVPATVGWRQAPLHALASLFGVGYLPFFPGTWGSLATLTACYYLFPFLTMENLLIATGGLFAFGFLLLIPLLKNLRVKDADPSYIVIDEAVGQLIALLPVVGLMEYWPVAFIAFRFFDIKKPLLVSWPELNLHGSPTMSSLGIMLDDVLAGLYAAGATYIVFFITTYFVF